MVGEIRTPTWGGGHSVPCIASVEGLVLGGYIGVDEALLDRYSISCVGPVPSSPLPAKDAGPQLAMGPSGRVFGHFQYLRNGCNFREEEGSKFMKEPGIVLVYLLMVSQHNLSALDQSWLYGSQWCVVSQVCSCSRDLFKRPLPLAQLVLSLSMATVTEGRPINIQ